MIIEEEEEQLEEVEEKPDTELCLLSTLEREFESKFSIKHSIPPDLQIWAEARLGILYVHIPKQIPPEKHQHQ